MDQLKHDQFAHVVECMVVIGAVMIFEIDAIVMNYGRIEMDRMVILYYDMMCMIYQLSV